MKGRQALPLITLDGVCMEFNGKRVLSNISLEIPEGEIMGIIGRSGAGKTVLMHLLRGVDQPPTSGRVLYHVVRCAGCGRVELPSRAGEPCPVCGGTFAPIDVDLWGADDHLRRELMARTAIMFQRTFALYGNDRVIENVIHALDDVGYPGEKAVGRAADLLDEVRLSHRMMHIARDLSGGEKQRVVLARQLAKEPFFLFADEPTGTLDPETAAIVHGVLKTSVKDQGMGMVVTSHFSNVIESLADRALLLENGEVIALGNPAEVVARFMQDYADLEAFEKPDLGENLLVARDVMKRYISVDRGVVRAVNGVGFDVKRGEIFGIIGRSGAGKTTLSRIIAGIIEPTGGEMNIRVGDEWVDMTKPGIENRGRAKGYIGLLHQEYDLFPHRTVLDNLTDAIGLEFPKELAMRKAIVTL
ncbi:MAG: methyl coenzyme M reductase system, component A2, partial [Methanospirillum sp.]